VEILERNTDHTKIIKSFKRVAWFYNFWSWLTESRAAKEVINLAGIKGGESILEVACGTGVVFEKIVRRNPGGINVGIDLSPDMLEKARKRLKKATGNFKLNEGDALNIDFEEHTFDIIINNFMVDLMPEETFSKIAREFYRILKPHGVVIISTFSFGTKKINRIWFWIARHFPELLTGCRPVSFQKYLIKSGFSIEKELQISQNTFPSEIIKARKTNLLI